MRAIDYWTRGRCLLGMGGKWTAYVLSVHVIWSICTPIALAESLLPGRAREPWLRTRGLVIAAVVFVLACALLTAGALATKPIFRPTLPQMITTGVVALVLVVAAFAIRPGDPRRRLPGAVPSVPVFFVGALVAAGAVVAYGWSSFFLTPIVGSTDPVIVRVGNVVYCLVALVILVPAYRTVRATPSVTVARADQSAAAE
jgi:hypothetical protein